jgi:hypothetical protein
MKSTQVARLSAFGTGRHEAMVSDVWQNASGLALEAGTNVGENDFEPLRMVRAEGR